MIKIEMFTMKQDPYYHQGRGDIDISSDPPGATIYIDGYTLVDDKGNPLKTPVTAVGAMEGMHEIQISMDRYYSKKVFVDVIPGKVNRAFVKLLPIS